MSRPGSLSSLILLCTLFGMACSGESGSNPDNNNTTTGGGTTTGGFGTGGLSGTGSAPNSGGGPLGTGSAATSGGAGATAGSSGGNTYSGSLALSNLVIEPNPRMPLSAYVSWTTAEPASSEVQFGEGTYTKRIADDTPTTEHRVHVVGMRASSSFNIRAISTVGTESGSTEGTYTTPALPGKLGEKVGTSNMLIADTPDKSYSGWTLTNFQSGSPTGNVVAGDSPEFVIILDETGDIIWYYQHGTQNDARGELSTEWVPATQSVLIGPVTDAGPLELDLEVNPLWNGPEPMGLDHHVSKLSTGNYLLIRSQQQNGDDWAQELSPQNQVVWEWKLSEHLDELGSGLSLQGDWCHANSLSMDEANGFLYMNCRWQGVIKVNKNTGAVAWWLGADNDGNVQGDFTWGPSSNPDPQLNDAHDPEFDFASGKVIFFDNQGWEGHTPNTATYHSRVVEYDLDEGGMSATLSWEFPGNFTVDSWYTDTWHSPFWGDADVLPNGNILVTAPTRGVGTETRIFEVTRSGEIVWAVAYPDDNGAYRADRFPALATPITP